MFDNIRPLYDSELPEAMRTITASPMFAQLAAYVYPGEDPKAVAERICAIPDIYTMQDTVMRAAIEHILANSITDFTHSGTDQLVKGRPYLFVSNHRDIVLDAFLLQYLLLYYNELYITFGANLMQDPTITLIGRANRMFRVERGGTPKEFYRNMLQVSQYIRQVIVSDQHSVWIAQRNGRTKDGLDRTEVSVLKMFALSGRSTREAPLLPLKALNIVPVSISYEWEPCDLLKARELHMRATGPYKKAKGEDMNSVLTGILQPKGHVHLSINAPLTDEEIDRCSATDSPFENLAALIDRRITTGYRLHPTNYLAYDLVHHTTHFADHYSPALKQQFQQRIAAIPDAEKNILLDIYSNPVEQQYPTLI